MKLSRRQLRRLINEMYSTTLPTGVSHPDAKRIQISQEAWMKALEQSGFTRGDLIDAKLMYHRNYDWGGGYFGALIPSTSHYAYGDDPQTKKLAMEIQDKMDREREEKEDMKKYSRPSYKRSAENIEQVAYQISLLKGAMKDGLISRPDFIKHTQDITKDLPHDVLAKVYKLANKKS